MAFKRSSVRPPSAHGVSDPNEERISRIVTAFVTKTPSVVALFFHKLLSAEHLPFDVHSSAWFALNRKIGDLKLLDHFVRPHQ
jgi:hypothetical protein